jgi:hypothetical protein
MLNVRAGRPLPTLRDIVRWTVSERQRQEDNSVEARSKILPLSTVRVAQIQIGILMSSSKGKEVIDRLVQRQRKRALVRGG